MTRQHQDRHAVPAMHLDPVDRHVLHAGTWIARNHEAGGNVRPVVVLAVGRDRQQRVQVDALRVDDLLARRFFARHFLPCNGMFSGIAKAFEQGRFGHAHRFGDP